MGLRIWVWEAEWGPAPDKQNSSPSESGFAPWQGLVTQTTNNHLLNVARCVRCSSHDISEVAEVQASTSHCYLP